MRRWIVYGGIGLIIGGVTSLAMTLGVEGEFEFRESFTSYSVGWLVTGVAMIIIGLVLKPKNRIQD